MKNIILALKKTPKEIMDQDFYYYTKELMIIGRGCLNIVDQFSNNYQNQRYIGNNTKLANAIFGFNDWAYNLKVEDIQRVDKEAPLIIPAFLETVTFTKVLKHRIRSKVFNFIKEIDSGCKVAENGGSLKISITSNRYLLSDEIHFKDEFDFTGCKTYEELIIRINDFLYRPCGLIKDTELSLKDMAIQIAKNLHERRKINEANKKDLDFERSVERLEEAFKEARLIAGDSNTHKNRLMLLLQSKARSIL